MNIGILLCDHVKEQFSTEHGQYPDMFAKLLHRVDPTLTFSVYDVGLGQLPETVDEADAYLITGSRYGVNDELPWIGKLEELVYRLHESQKKIVGICFGHQLIAKILGGKVTTASKGWGIGMSTNKVALQKPWMIPQQENLNLLVSHQDQVVELPQNAQILAHSDFCPFYMLQINDNLLTVQGHPEFSKAYSKALIEDRITILGQELAEAGLNSLTLPVDDNVFAKWIVNFLHG